MPACQEVPFQPSLALMLAQHFHDPAVRRKLIIIVEALRHPGAVGNFEHVLPSIRIVLVRTEEAKIFVRQTKFHHVAQESSHHARRLGIHGSGARHFDGVIAKIRQAEFLEQETAVRMWVGAHPPRTFGWKLGQLSP